MTGKYLKNRDFIKKSLKFWGVYCTKFEKFGFLLQKIYTFWIFVEKSMKRFVFIEQNLKN